MRQHKAYSSIGKFSVSLKHSPCRGIMGNRGGRQAEAIS